MQDAARGIRLAARLVDTPANEMHTDAFVEVSLGLRSCCHPPATLAIYDSPLPLSCFGFEGYTDWNTLLEKVINAPTPSGFKRIDNLWAEIRSNL